MYRTTYSLPVAHALPLIAPIVLFLFLSLSPIFLRISSTPSLPPLSVQFKRSFGAKNAGTLFPGWGGLLDRLDGLLFTFPFSVFVYFTFFTHLTTG